MPKLAQFKQRINNLKDIRTIITSLASMALMEYNHVAASSHYLADMTDSLQTTLASLLRHQEYELSGRAVHDPILIIVGSERGFCSHFNRKLINAFHRHVEQGQKPQTIIIGRRLASLFSNEQTQHVIPGPGTFDDIPQTIEALIEQLAALNKNRSLNTYAPWLVISNRLEDYQLHTAITDPYEHILFSREGGHEQIPPLIQLNPIELIESLIEQYITNWLYQVFYESFEAENLIRYHHLSAAEEELDGHAAKLDRRMRRLRETAITSEIENLLTSAKMVIKRTLQ